LIQYFIFLIRAPLLIIFGSTLLVGYILFAAWSRYDSVKEDCPKMEELKVQAEAADVAKSQVCLH
jgi:arabidopsis histidine kinase 2/3/4 (cytokinin receptor)